MVSRNLTELIDRAMDRTEMDSLRIEREFGIPASWVRQLKAGRIKEKPDPGRVTRLAQALRIPEAEIWRHLGRFDRVAELRGELPPGAEEVLSPELIAAVDVAVERAVRAVVDRLTELGWRPPEPPSGGDGATPRSPRPTQR